MEPLILPIQALRRMSTAGGIFTMGPLILPIQDLRRMSMAGGIFTMVV